MTKPDLKKYLSTNPVLNIRKYYKETSNLRKLLAPIKTQGVENLSPANPKEEKGTKTTTRKKNKQQLTIAGH